MLLRGRQFPQPCAITPRAEPRKWQIDDGPQAAFNGEPLVGDVEVQQRRRRLVVRGATVCFRLVLTVLHPPGTHRNPERRDVEGVGVNLHRAVWIGFELQLDRVV